MVDSFTDGNSRRLVWAERRERRPGRSATRTSWLRYDGAVPWVALYKSTTILNCTLSWARNQWRLMSALHDARPTVSKHRRQQVEEDNGTDLLSQIHPENSQWRYYWLRFRLDKGTGEPTQTQQCPITYGQFTPPVPKILFFESGQVLWIRQLKSTGKDEAEWWIGYTIRYDTRCYYNVRSEVDICSEVSVNSPGNPWSQSWRRKRRLWQELFTEKEGFKPGMQEWRGGGYRNTHTHV